MGMVSSSEESIKIEELAKPEEPDDNEALKIWKKRQRMIIFWGLIAVALIVAIVFQ